MTLDEKFKKFKKEEERLEELKIKKKASRTTLAFSVLYVIHHIILIVGFVAFIVWLASDPPTVADKMSNGQAGAVLLGVFGGMGLFFWTAIGLMNWFMDWKDEVYSFWRNFYSKKNEEEALKAGASERKEFFKFYELMKDPDFRDGYLRSLNPDDELRKKFKEELDK